MYKTILIAALAIGTTAAYATPGDHDKDFKLVISNKGFALAIGDLDDFHHWTWNERRHCYWDGRAWRTREEYLRLEAAERRRFEDRDDHRWRDRDDHRWRDRDDRRDRDDHRWRDRDDHWDRDNHRH